MDESGSGETSISDEEYKHYVGRRRGFATAARSEVVAEHYPGKNFDSLSKGEWQTIDVKINERLTLKNLKGQVIFKSGYPVGVFFKGCEIFSEKFKGSENNQENFKGSDNNQENFKGSENDPVNFKGCKISIARGNKAYDIFQCQRK